MTDRVDRETVEEIARENELQGEIRHYRYEAVFETSPLGEKTAKTLRALLAERDALEAEVERLRKAVKEAIYMLDPEAEDVLKYAGIYRIVLAYSQAGGILPDDLKDALDRITAKQGEE